MGCFGSKEADVERQPSSSASRTSRPPAIQKPLPAKRPKGRTLGNSVASADPSGNSSIDDPRAAAAVAASVRVKIVMDPANLNLKIRHDEAKTKNYTGKLSSQLSKERNKGQRELLQQHAQDTTNERQRQDLVWD